MPREDVKKLLRSKFMPHIWCPGCGHGIIMHAILRALADLQIPKEQICISSGIGCSSRMPGYIDACTLHTAHGRSLAFATGVKMANPELTIVNVMGDGDGTAIGGNHFIHACRRNIGITAVVMNNNIYGMTGGQASPTTPEGAFAATAPYGAIDPVFDVCKLAEGAGATYVARATVANPMQCEQILKKAIEHQKKGFAVVEIVTYCPTQFGRKNKRSRPTDNIKYLKEHSVLKAQADKMSPEELKDKIVVGNTIPEVTYSFGVHMGWKGLSLEAQFQGVGEVYTYPRANLAVPFNNGAGVTRDWATDSWTESNRHSKLPLLTTYTDAPENFIPSTKWLRNASYLRMKNIQLTYDFPKRLLRPLRIEALQIYVSGQNLWTISDFDLWDPEITTTRTDLYEYPNLKTVSIGLNLSF